MSFGRRPRQAGRAAAAGARGRGRARAVAGRAGGVRGLPPALGGRRVPAGLAAHPRALAALVLAAAAAVARAQVSSSRVCRVRVEGSDAGGVSQQLMGGLTKDVGIACHALLISAC